MISDSGNDKQNTHFGFQTVTTAEKTQRVHDVFAGVANRYDLMNDVMSFGLHRVWKRMAITVLNVRKGQAVLDLAGGTGDLTQLIIQKVGAGRVVLSDINPAMLAQGRDKLFDQGLGGRFEMVEANAEALPFDDNTFDRLIIGFGLRNVTHQDRAIAEMQRVLKPQGKAVILEFSKPVFTTLQKVYDAYSFYLLPKLGEWIANDKDSYQYLVESIRMHPDQETLKQKMVDAGFVRVEYQNLSGGIVALHSGYKA